MSDGRGLPKMIGLREAAKETGLSYSYLRKLCMNGRITFVRSGNKYLLNADKLADFLNNENGGGQNE